MPAGCLEMRLPGWSSRAAVGHDEVRRDAEQEADAEHVEPELAVPEPARPGPDLAEHEENRAAGEREEHQLQRIGRDLVADHRAYERRPAGHQPGDDQPAPGRPDVPEWPDDAEALGGVVQRKA